MTSDRLVSIIIPARNAELTLSRTLESLIAQTDSKWEALIIDDSSIDGTSSIIAEYIARDSRFITFDANAGSASAARNVGISHANCERLLFLDSDDWIAPNFLAKMSAVLDANPSAVAVYCDYTRVFADGSETPVRGDSRIQSNAIAEFNRTCATAIHTVLVKRSAVLAIGGFDATLRTCEEWDLWQKIAWSGGRWIHLNEKLSYYWGGDHSLSQNVEQMLADARIVIARGASRAKAVEEPGAPLKSVGSPDTSPDAAYAFFALWCAGFECGRGRESSVSNAIWASLPRSDASADVMAGTLLDAIVIGARLAPARLASSWKQYGSAVTRLIGSIGDAWRDRRAAQKIQYTFERKVLDYDNLESPRELTLTLGLRVDLGWLPHLHLGPSIDRLYVYLCDGPHILAVLDIGVLGSVGPRFWARLVTGHLRYRELQKDASRLNRLKLELYKKMGRLFPERDEESHFRQLNALRQKNANQVDNEIVADRRLGVVRPRQGVEAARNERRELFWDGFFEQEDPWNYGSAYEQEKYRRQLELLPGEPVANALELACAEGYFTELLAPRVGRLLACDISRKALERARLRCMKCSNIDFEQLDLSKDDYPSGVDLVLCSEALYYLADEAELELVVKRLVSALRPGGYLVSAHSFVLKDNMERTGFDWDNAFGAETIARVMGNNPEIALDASIQTELYRVDRYKRGDSAERKGIPQISVAEVKAPIAPEVARCIVWNGAVARRSAAIKSERRSQLPILMYHRVAVDGPAKLARFRVPPTVFREQMLWLRRNGYHGIDSEQLAWFVEHKHPFVGRPVLITFDDGYRDFADSAWPILQENDFTAELFVVTKLVGKCADWDAPVGDTAPLLGVSDLVRLAREGVKIGSHLATHPRSDELSTEELAEELLSSRAQLEKWLRRPVMSLAAPYGCMDQRFGVLAAECGYRTVFNTANKVASISDDLFDLPRLEIQGGITIEAFANCMKSFQ
ncbi:hypothetical protein XI09_29420 [Bradyrhizobium sp. CCBAU 11386]|uniref:trifunctional glycosyltransferase/class I SAM-dependent methyltransferase/polysaccharide deacetylase n=1 Tax=Bradyrhizobium sp. CCBAU 11386 TaxID=1630837 RepID=UPI0023026827|nr:trifunctional glycosyltransferase/class I SAM-dependent methyltransferase/polysaccharide deacetylase [Bradyrhizobium sp. CCBAU 11386]MDA9508691.1 hypothetical protein [Bradyrhizobium sp. CCBAU 11386]